MAEINIARKRPVWPWIVGVAAVIAAMFVWAAVTEGPARDVVLYDRYSPAGTTGAARGAVDDYLAFAGIGGAAENPAMGLEHDYTAEGIRKLSAALQNLVDDDGDADSREKFDRFRQAADRIQQDPASLGHADQVRNAFTMAADVIESLDDVPSAATVRSAAESIDPGQPLLEQKEKIRNFFRESARAIQTASRR
jgi:hypothetical protein